jgi:hypothetical protein
MSDLDGPMFVCAADGLPFKRPCALVEHVMGSRLCPQGPNYVPPAKRRQTRRHRRSLAHKLVPLQIRASPPWP